MDDASPAPDGETGPGPGLELEPRRFIVTPTLVAMNVAYFLAMVSVGVPATSPTAMDVIPFGANFGPFIINDGEWWRLLSSTFIHFGVLHLAFNMWCLWSLGNLAERLFGNGRFLSIYMLSGVGGSAASVLWHPGIPSAGASGAVFGMAGALAAFLYLARIHLPARAARDLLTSIMIFIAFNLAFGFTVPGIDNAGHLGGLLVGAVLGASLRSRRAFPAVAAVVVAALIGTAFLTTSLTQDNPTLILAQAEMLTATDRAGAIEQLEIALAEHPALAEGHARLGELYLQERRYPEAFNASSKAIELDHEQRFAQGIIGSALYWMGDYEAAAVALQRAIQVEPKQLVTHALLSRSLRALGRDREARSVLEEGLKYARGPSALFADIGFERLDDVELEFLMGALKEEIEITPEDPENYNVLSLVLARTGAHDEALEAVRTALELRPDAPHIMDSLATVHLYRGELDDAVKAYREAIEIQPDYSVYHYNLSLALRRRGDVAEADAALNQARRLVPHLDPPADAQPIM